MPSTINHLQVCQDAEAIENTTINAYKIIPFIYSDYIHSCHYFISFFTISIWCVFPWDLLRYISLENHTSFCYEASRSSFSLSYPYHWPTIHDIHSSIINLHLCNIHSHNSILPAYHMLVLSHFASIQSLAIIIQTSLCALILSMLTDSIIYIHFNLDYNNHNKRYQSYWCYISILCYKQM